MKKRPEHLLLGESGEESAKAYLVKKGYEILAANWRSGRAEVDIIARIGNDLVFVEVKTRSTSYFGFPEQAVSRKKQQQLQKAADAYIQENTVLSDIRFDVVAVLKQPGGVEIHHIEDAFFPGLEM